MVDVEGRGTRPETSENRIDEQFRYGRFEKTGKHKERAIEEGKSNMNHKRKTI
ncbi:MAG: hypothetical protein IJH64_09460 [Oscillospiraceae bacterium]|nr:hypothetical protein [Oscillospiraceae bacterium]